MFMFHTCGLCPMHTCFLSFQVFRNKEDSKTNVLGFYGEKHTADRWRESFAPTRTSHFSLGSNHSRIFLSAVDPPGRMKKEERKKKNEERRDRSALLTFFASWTIFLMCIDHRFFICSIFSARLCYLHFADYTHRAAEHSSFLYFLRWQPSPLTTSDSHTELRGTFFQEGKKVKGKKVKR